MKKFFWAIFVLLCSLNDLYSQFAENFDDNDFTQHPEWVGDLEKFEIIEGQLRLQAEAISGEAFLATSSEAIQDAVWEWKVGMEFNPSDNNLCRLYLTADQSDFSEGVNGYFVQVGGSADEVSLYAQTGSSIQKIIDGIDGRLDYSQVEVRVKVTRDSLGKWSLYSKKPEDPDFLLEGMASTAGSPIAGYVGIYCVYTASRSDKFYFDDIKVSGSIYESPYGIPKPLELIITEIMPDPTPTRGLPEQEFIEVYNNSDKTFNLQGWVVGDLSGETSLPFFELKPYEYVFLVDQKEIARWIDYSNVLGVQNLPTLNNDEDALCIRSADRVMLDSIYYEPFWFSEGVGQEGGWSLERIDLNNPCRGKDNWAFSVDPSGGTPGRKNSNNANNPDLIGPILKKVIVSSPEKLILEFNEAIVSTSLSNGIFELAPKISLQVNGFYSHNRLIEILLLQPLQPGVQYQIHIGGLEDCAGNYMSDQQKMLFSLPEMALPLDIVINEILFNPIPGGVDFVELYNGSKKNIDLQGWSIQNEKDSLTRKNLITQEQYIMKPGSYVVLTSNGYQLKNQYPQLNSAVILEMAMPSLPDDRGHIQIRNIEGTIIDSMSYHSDMHNAIIVNEEGISLERLSASHSSGNVDNWKSASYVMATPGLINSNRAFNSRKISESIQVDPEIFEPVSGRPNYTLIHYSLSTHDMIGNVNIVDLYGRKIKNIASNVLLGSTGFFRWDGDRDDGRLVRMGYYFVWFEIFNLEGSVQTYRERVIITTSM